VELLILLLLLLSSISLLPKDSKGALSVANKREAFIALIAPAAQEAQRQYKWLSSVTIAQAILESADGESSLAKKYHNLFGIKGAGVALPTTEFIDGKEDKVTASFRTYDSFAASIMDRSEMLLNAKRGDGTYRYRHLAGSTDPVFVANGLQKAGYATDPLYAKKLIAIIESNDLKKFDTLPPLVSDFAGDAWAWAVEQKLVDGTNPQGALTREQFVTILHRFSLSK
jgi:flagellum-specific peptidoglycan hydrolase FlgJ